VQPTGDYGIDAPAVVRGLGMGVAIALLVTVVSGILDHVGIMAVAFGAAIVISLVGLELVRSSRVHKLRERVRVVDRLELQGDERVLDVGCGRGLLLVEVARRLNDQGRAYGVDRWHAVDGRVVDAERAIHNAQVEGVRHQLDVTSADVRALPYPDNSFDAVVSGLALHHIAGFEPRVHAIREIARVLKPGGRVVLIDRHHTSNYVDALRACNLVDVRRSRRIRHLVPPARYVTGTKPAAAPEPEVVPEPEPQDAVELEPQPEPEPEPEPALRVVLEPPPPPLPTPAFPTPAWPAPAPQLELSDAVTGECDGARHDAEHEAAEDGSSV
jgi:SAM-dependent methyltransferase